jgi:thioredoxin 1
MNTKLNWKIVLMAFAVVVASQAARAATASAGNLPKLVDLGADKCIPCKMMAPILQELKKEYAGRMDVEFIDVWKNEGAGKKYGIKLIPTQIFFAANGKELFRHEGFYGKEDILAKWKELGVDLSGKVDAGLVRETPVAADARPREAVCFMCDGDVNPKTIALVKGQTEQLVLCSPHCYFIYFSSIVNADPKAEDAKVSVTDWSTGSLVPATAASFVYGMDATGRATIAAFADREAALKHQQSNPGNLFTWDLLRSKELATRCGFCDRAV